MMNSQFTIILLLTTATVFELHLDWPRKPFVLKMIILLTLLKHPQNVQDFFICSQQKKKSYVVKFIKQKNLNSTCIMETCLIDNGITMQSLRVLKLEFLVFKYTLINSVGIIQYFTPDVPY